MFHAGLCSVRVYTGACMIPPASWPHTHTHQRQPFDKPFPHMIPPGYRARARAGQGSRAPHTSPGPLPLHTYPQNFPRWRQTRQANFWIPNILSPCRNPSLSSSSSSVTLPLTAATQWWANGRSESCGWSHVLQQCSNASTLHKYWWYLHKSSTVSPQSYAIPYCTTLTYSIYKCTVFTDSSFIVFFFV